MITGFFAGRLRTLRTWRDLHRRASGGLRIIARLWPAIILSLTGCGTLSQTPAPVGDQSLDQAFAAVNQAWYQQRSQTQNVAWVTDPVAGEQITYQVGYIGGYASFIGYDKAGGNAMVVLQNAFNWSNYSGIAVLVDPATQDRVVGQ